jgi:hypothetical protein
MGLRARHRSARRNGDTGLGQAADETPNTDTDATVARRLQDLDPDRISARDVAEVLARVPAPRIILLQGSLLP